MFLLQESQAGWRFQSLSSGLLLPSKSFMSWIKKSVEKLSQGTKRWLVHKLQQIVGSIERHHIPFFLERCILQFSCGSLSGSLYLQPWSSRLIVGRWNPRQNSHRPLLNLLTIAFQFLRTVPPFRSQKVCFLSGCDSEVHRQDPWEDQGWEVWKRNSRSFSARDFGLERKKSKLRVLGCWTTGPKSPLGEVENLLTCAGISIETGRLVTSWVMGSRFVVYFFLGLTFENSAKYRTYAYRIGSMSQPKPLYWPKWDPWKLQRNIMKKIVLIRGLVVAIWFIAEKIMIRFVCSWRFSYSSLTLGGFDPNPHRCL